MVRRLLLVALATAFALAVDAAIHGRHEPQGVHLSLGTGSDEIVVGWMTWEDETKRSVVEYELVGSARVRRAVGASRVFVDGGPERLVRRLHFVTLRGLEPGARYAYRVGDGSPPSFLPFRFRFGSRSRTQPSSRDDPSPRWSPRFEFRARRSRAQIAAGPPLTFIALCDAGHLDSAPVLSAIASEIEANLPDAVLHCGDLAYDLDTSDGRNGDAWMRDVEPIAARVPYMVSAGNHERAYNFSHYRARFATPGEGVRSENHYYSFDLGPAHVVTYNAEAFFWPRYFDAAYVDRMRAWLDDDLRAATANREATPWLILHAHRPMYCVRADDADRAPARKHPQLRGRCGWEQEAARLGVMISCEGDAYAAAGCAPSKVAVPEKAERVSPLDGEKYEEPARVEELLYRHGVDVAFFGHVHDYERYYPVYDEVTVNGTSVTFDRYVQPRATVHVTTGSGGNKEMKKPRGGGSIPRGRCVDSAPWCAFQSGHAPQKGQVADFTYSRVVVRDATTLEWTQMSATGGGDATPIDRFVVEARTHGSFERFVDDVASS
jgi:hypothetical protein